MRVEEMALRSEIRQMLNEAGFNKNTLKDMVKEVLNEEVEKAVRQAVNETDFDSYAKNNAQKIIKNSTNSYLKQAISDRIIGDWFHRMKVIVDSVKDTQFNSTT